MQVWSSLVEDEFEVRLLYANLKYFCYICVWHSSMHI